MADMTEIMKKFDIHEIAKNKLAEIEKYECSIYCCHSTGCKSSGSDDLIALIHEFLKEKGLTDKKKKKFEKFTIEILSKKQKLVSHSK